MKQSKVIGLTGGIASGKSTVSNYLKSKSIPIVDADIVSREVVMPGSKGLQAIVDTFGKDILEENHLNRKALRELVFNDEEKRLKLNRILHPIIHDEIQKQIQALKDNNEPIIIFDAPLLLENNLKYMVDELWLVSTSVEKQIARLIKRDNMTLETAESIISKQMPLIEKERLSDVILDNNSTVEALLKQVDERLKNHL
ncbi:MAG: dephospho-CoA kinase [Clostridiales bacterium]|nr:dephospho-CoA kinase [Clostridiales bacterium]